MGDDGAGDPVWIDSFLERQERLRKEVKETECLSELQEKFEGWGFSPTVDKYVQNLIDESGYWVHGQLEGTPWKVEIEPKNDGKFDLARARKALNELSDMHRAWELGLDCKNKDLVTLAGQLCSAAKTSLEKHGDLRDAVKEMGDYKLRDWSNPNASKRGDLRRILYLYVSAREQYKEDVDSHFAPTRTSEDIMGWLDERVRQFISVAAEYVDTPNAHTQWLTSEISAWLLRPCIDTLGRGVAWSFPANRIGARWKQPWCVVVPWCISILLFLLFLFSVMVVVAVYEDRSALPVCVAAGLYGLMYARRYLQTREFRKERERLTRVCCRISRLHNEVKNGKYNVGEVIRQFRQFETDDLGLPSIFVSVIALPKLKPARQPAAQALELNL